MQFPGDSSTTLVNKPSDGGLRNVSNFLFLKNNQNPTGVIDKITIYPLTSYVLVGNSVQLTAKGTDTSYYPVDLLGVDFTVKNNSNNTVTKTGYFTAVEDGISTVYATFKNITGITNIVCVDKPTIKVTKENGSIINDITTEKNQSR